MSPTVRLSLCAAGLFLVTVVLGWGLLVALPSGESTLLVTVWLPALLAAGMFGTAGVFTVSALRRPARTPSVAGALRVARTMALAGAGVGALALALAVAATAVGAAALLGCCVVVGVGLGFAVAGAR